MAAYAGINCNDTRVVRRVGHSQTQYSARDVRGDHHMAGLTVTTLMEAQQDILANAVVNHQ
jgi:hypothetical protein